MLWFIYSIRHSFVAGSWHQACMFTTLFPWFLHQWIHDIFFKENGKVRIMDGFLSCLKCFLIVLQCIFLTFSWVSLKFILLKIYILPVFVYFSVLVFFLCQGFELLLSALGDPSERVVSATHQVFLPAYAAWTTELGNLQSHLIPTLLNKIEKLLRVNISFVYITYGNIKGVF